MQYLNRDPDFAGIREDLQWKMEIECLAALTEEELPRKQDEIRAVEADGPGKEGLNAGKCELSSVMP